MCSCQLHTVCGVDVRLKSSRNFSTPSRHNKLCGDQIGRIQEALVEKAETLTQLSHSARLITARLLSKF